jgi:hypothetical protein
MVGWIGFLEYKNRGLVNKFKNQSIFYLIKGMTANRMQRRSCIATQLGELKLK